MTDSWNAEQSREIYAVEHWGEGYFDVGATGNVIVYPTRNPGQGAIDLVEIAQAVRAEGLSLPVLVRFIDILRDRVACLNQAFALARREYDYRGQYTPVYPIKVNQQR
ncbi:MAG: arginine decarboxylase, partial [Methylococcus sp.]